MFLPFIKGDESCVADADVPACESGEIIECAGKCESGIGKIIGSRLHR